MAVVEELQIIIDAKVTHAVKNLKNVQKGLGDTGKASTKLKTLFKQLAGPLAIGAVLFTTIKLGKEFSKAASDAEEIGSKYATIFRDIRGDAEEVANTFAENFGLAGSTARELLGNTADLLTGLGFTQQGALELSEQVNTLAADLASFSNFAGGTTGASEALTKALLGEAEMAKALGIVINQNTKEYKDAIKFYTEVEGKTLLQAKAFTALQFATEQSGNAIGDVARTFESHANVSRRLEESTKALKEELGKAVNKGLTPMLSLTEKLVSGLTEWLRVGGEIADMQREQNEALEAVASGTATANQEYLAQKILLEELVETYFRIAQADPSAKALLTLQKQIDEQRRLLSFMVQNLVLSEKLNKETAAADEANAIAAKEREKEAKFLKGFYDKTKEAQIESLKVLIKEFETYQQIGTVLFVLRDLRAELNELTKEEIDLADTLKEATDRLFGGRTKVADEWLAKQQMIDQAYIVSIEATTEAEIKAAKVAEDLFKQRIANAEALASQTLSFLSAISDFRSASDAAELQRLEDQGASQEELDAKKRQIAHNEAIRKKKLGLLSVGVDTAAAIIRMLADPGGIAGVILSAFAAATGAVQAAAINAVPIPSLATGGRFVTDGPTMIGNNLVGDNASGQERVTVEPLGGSSDNTGQIMILRVGDRDLKAVVQGWINNRGLHSSRGGAI